MRKAISLIELVFAIVIMGIVVMSFPLILTQTSSNIAFAIQQEALLSAKTYMGTILSHDWDKNSVVHNIAGGKAMVLDTTDSTSADSEFNLSNDKRKGFIEGYGRRAMQYNGTAFLTPTAVSDGEWGSNTLADIDDFHNNAQNLAVTVENMDYILNFTLSAKVNYISDGSNSDDYSKNIIKFTFPDTGVTGITNIKMITVDAINAGRKVNIRLRAYSSNIGEYDLLERSFE